MDPATATMAAAAISAAAQGASGAMNSADAAAGSRRGAREKKRQTLAEMYRDALRRQIEMQRFSSEQGGLNAQRRQQALQETSNGFSRALTGK